MIMLAQLSTQDKVTWSYRFIYPLRTESHDHVSSSLHSGHGVTCSCLLVYHGIPLRTWPLHVHVCSSNTEYHSGHGRYMSMSARLSRNTTQDMAVTCSCQLVCHGIPLRTWPLHVHVGSSITEYHSGYSVTCSCQLVYHGIPLRTWPLHVHVSSSIKEYQSEHGRYMFMSARLSKNTTQDMSVTCSCQLVYQGIPRMITQLVFQGIQR